MEDIFIPVHAIAASTVVLLGPVQFIRRPKDHAHRYIGRSWVIAMYLTCVSGMFIYSINGSFTVFHALAIFTFGTTTLGVLAIRRGNVRRHVGNMVGSWAGACGAGVFAVVIPQRAIPQVAVHHPALFWGMLVGIVLACTAWVTYVLRHLAPTAHIQAGTTNYTMAG